MVDSFVTSPSSPPTCGACSAKYAAATTAVILMKNWIMSMTSTPHRPECAANATFSRPTNVSVCQRSKPKRIAAILHAARLTVAMMMQLKNRPRYSALNPRTTLAGVPE